MPGEKQTVEFAEINLVYIQCFIPVFDGEKVRGGHLAATLRYVSLREGAEIDFIFCGAFLSVFEQKQRTSKEYPYENGRFSPVKFWAYEILSYICTPERV